MLLSNLLMKDGFEHSLDNKKKNNQSSSLHREGIIVHALDEVIEQEQKQKRLTDIDKSVRTRVIELRVGTRERLRCTVLIGAVKLYDTDRDIN